MKFLPLILKDCFSIILQALKAILRFEPLLDLAEENIVTCFYVL